MNCPYCKKVIADSANFCGKCGHKIARCPSCNRVLSYKIKVCPYDGTELSDEAIQDLPEMMSDKTIQIRPTIQRDESRVVPSSTKYCKLCGKKFSGESTICPKCSENNVQQKENTDVTKKRKLMPLVMSGILIFVLVLGGIGLACSHFLPNNVSNDDQSTSKQDDSQAAETSYSEMDVENKVEDSDVKVGAVDEAEPISEATSNADIAQEDSAIQIAQRYSSNAVEYKNHAYVIFDYKDENLDSFDECEEFCERMGGHLAVINSQDENDFLYNYVTDSGFELAFFGYTDQDTEGQWKWVTDSDNTYTNWCQVSGREQPNNGSTNPGGKSENYAEFFKNTKDGTWNDAPFGSNTYHFICEWE